MSAWFDRSTRHWSRFLCRRCEWNDALRHDFVCGTFALAISPCSEPISVADHLIGAKEGMADPEMKNLLKGRIEVFQKQFKSGATSPNGATSYQKTDSHWKGCNYKRDQVVADVPRLQQVLDTAAAEEKTAAESFAPAALAKLRAERNMLGSKALCPHRTVFT
ncbi:unnamed protein product [Prorocentrum cordatum]|uniref:Uncharacterized protein n=1 Tax=Prorocentrum cordatum TaxID=2364126 RepID=A0ABN9Q7I8_9DINO|nr:unnamed protein product [Polarella glacialis]